MRSGSFFNVCIRTFEPRVCLYAEWGLYYDISANIYQFKGHNRNARRCEKCSTLTIKTPERRHLRYSVVFIVNFEHIAHVPLVVLLLTLSINVFSGIRVFHHFKVWNSFFFPNCFKTYSQQAFGFAVMENKGTFLWFCHKQPKWNKCVFGKLLSRILKLVSAIFYQIFIFHQMIAL